MKLQGHDIGVCSWSLRPSGLDELFARLEELKLDHVQLALADFVAAADDARAEMVQRVRSSGRTVTATMISFAGEDYKTIASIRRTGGFAPDDAWPGRKASTIEAAKISQAIGVALLSTHVGFVPMSSDPNYRVMVERVGDIATAIDAHGVSLLLETGQESASELLQFLNDLRVRNVGVNFDPANMILYGAGDPIEAVRTVGRHIRHVHLKDAVSSDHPGTQWGDEVPFGSGEVPVGEFLEALKDVGYTGPLVIEREAGEDRMGDVKAALHTLQSLG